MRTDLRPGRAFLRSGKADLRPGRADSRPRSLDLMTGRAVEDGGKMKSKIQISPCGILGHWPLWECYPKGILRERDTERDRGREREREFTWL